MGLLNLPTDKEMLLCFMQRSILPIENRQYSKSAYAFLSSFQEMVSSALIAASADVVSTFVSLM